MRRVLTITGVLFALLLCVLSLPVVHTAAHAYVNETDFYLKTFEIPSHETVFNGEDGCVYRVLISQDAYPYFIRVEYDVVRLQGAEDTPVPGENNKVSGYEYISEGTVVTKDQLTLAETPTAKRYAYFEVTAHEWCAFIFTVYYEGTEGETAAYDSQVLTSRCVDNSVPEAYYTDWVYDSGEYVFSVTVRDNRRTDSLSAKSGLKSFAVLKDGVKIDEVTGIGSSTYQYSLRVPRQKAVYAMDILDRVGNGVRVKIVEFTETSYDGDFETACEVVLTDMEEGLYAGYSEKVLKSFREKYAAYYLLIQSDASDEEIEAAKSEVNDVARYLAQLRKMQENGEKEVVVLSPNATEYFGQELTIRNASAAYTDQLYGEKLTYTLSVAELSPKTPSRASARAAAGINDASTLYSITVYLAKDGETISTAFVTPLKIRIPIDCPVVAVQTTDGQSKVLNAARGNGYVEVEVLSSYGTVDVFIDGKKDLNYLWSLTAIPVVAGAIVLTVVLLKKKKKNNLSAPEKQEE